MGKIDKPAGAPAHEGGGIAERQPLLILASGRQRVGKTTLLNAMVEIYRANGADLEVWNADLHNRTHTISLFHGDALEPSPNLSPEEQRAWLEERLCDQVAHRRDVVLDVGGGLTALNTLVEEVRLVEMLERRGIRVVLLYVLGNERADLDYLDRLAGDGTFMPSATLLVFNAGILTGGRTARTAFTALMEHAAVKRAIKNGARVLQMPPLNCMAAVTDRGLSFGDFAVGKQATGHAETSFFDQERVELWLKRDMPRFFLSAPADWMPRTPAPIVAEL